MCQNWKNFFYTTVSHQQLALFFTSEFCVNSESVAELLNEIQKLHKTFLSDEKRVRSSTKAVEDSMDTRQKVKHKLDTCKCNGNLAMLRKKVKELSVVKLNQKVRKYSEFSLWP